MKNNLREIVRFIRRIKNLISEFGIHRLLRGLPHWGQFGEDVILKALFSGKKNGFFVDVGAHHPVKLSNTYLLTRLGWTGLNLEPLPKNFQLFVKHRPHDINLNLAISGEEGEVSFVMDSAYSGIDDEGFPSEYRRSARPKIRVKTKPLSMILDDHLPNDQEIDVLSVDCEGHDLQVLKSNDWKRFRPKVIVFEVHEGERLLEFVKAQGYSHFITTGLSAIYIREDFTNRVAELGH